MRRIIIGIAALAMMLTAIGGCYMNHEGASSAREYYYNYKAYDPHNPFDIGGRHDRGLGGE